MLFDNHLFDLDIYLKFLFLVSLFASDSCIVSCFAQVAPPSAHAVISSAAKFLLNWLFEYQHEYQQWSAAISLGLVSNCLHATDKQLKFEVITGLLKVHQSHISTRIWCILLVLQSLYAKLPVQIYCMPCICIWKTF